MGITGLSQWITSAEDKLAKYQKLKIFTTTIASENDGTKNYKPCSEKDAFTVMFNPATVRIQYTVTQQNKTEETLSNPAGNTQSGNSLSTGNTSPTQTQVNTNTADDKEKRFGISFDLFFDFTDSLYDGTEMTGWLANAGLNAYASKAYSKKYEKTYKKFESIVKAQGDNAIVYLIWGNTFLNYYSTQITKETKIKDITSKSGILGFFRRMSVNFDFFDEHGNPRKIRCGVTFEACPTLKPKAEVLSTGSEPALLDEDDSSIN